MAHGRASFVLGVQAGVDGIAGLCEGLRKGLPNGPPSSAGAGSLGASIRGRRSDAEILSILGVIAQIDRGLRREGVEVLWSAMGATGSQDMLRIGAALGLSIDARECVTIEDLQCRDLDLLVYVPLDVLQPRQVEQLARLSMVAPRVRHVAVAEAPKWTQAQLIALKETWAWVDPRKTARMSEQLGEFVRATTGVMLEGGACVETRPDFPEPNIVTRSPVLKDILTLVDAVADTDSTILITGDSGTGKELIAQRIHAKSHRRQAALVAVNCGAIPAELLESELFGHVKGAFTGAISNREGRFQAAEGGTLFLDEIGEMTPSLQVKLLRVLQSKHYEPVGATKSRAANVRIIAATNRDLEDEVKQGRFREDLYYRLNVIPVHVPRLRERSEDVQLLVEHFVRRFNTEKSRRVTGVTRAALRSLVAYEWPGNVRELENLVERMVILKSSGMIDVLDFPEKYRRKSLSEIEYDDLMNSRRMTHVQVPQIPIIETNFEEQTGEEDMKISGTTYTKNVIEQTAPQAQQGGIARPAAQGGEIIANGNLTIDQILQLVADRFSFPNEGLDFNSIVDQFENILILHALERTGWNRNRAAGLLRLNRTTLVEKLKKKQLVPPMSSIGGDIVEGTA